jgi:hypothetical protein
MTDAGRRTGEQSDLTYGVGPIADGCVRRDEARDPVRSIVSPPNDERALPEAAAGLVQPR